MLRGIGFVCGAAVLCASCNTVPDISQRDYVSVSDLLINLECEFKSAIERIAIHYPEARAKEQEAVATLTLKVTETGVGDGDASIVIPISNGTFTLGFDAGITRKNVRDTELKVAYHTGELECPENFYSPDYPTRFANGLGLEEWLDNMAEQLTVANDDPTSMTYSVEFNITTKGGVKPQWGIQLGSGHKYSAAIDINGKREKVHKLRLTVATIKLGEEADDAIARGEASFLLGRISD